MRKIGFFDIYVNDMDRAQSFYETVLDTTLTTMGDPTNPIVNVAKALAEVDLVPVRWGRKFSNPEPVLSTVNGSCSTSKMIAKGLVEPVLDFLQAG